MKSLSEIAEALLRGRKIAPRTDLHGLFSRFLLNRNNEIVLDANTPASQAEMEAGTETSLRLMSPKSIAQAIAALPSGDGVPEAPVDDVQYARKNAAWVEVVAGAAAPESLTPSANVKFGPAAGAGITDVLPAAPAAGDRAKYYIKPTGDKTLDFDAAILKPTDSGLTLPKTMTSGKTYVVLMEFNGTAWMLVSLVGGY